MPWKRTRRVGRPAEPALNHLMASAAIAVLFPAVRLRNEYFGDGSMRESAPLSPALHLGANHLLITGARILPMGIGALAREGRPLMSYLLFDAPDCRELMDLGYRDALASRDQVLHLPGYEELIDEPAGAGGNA